MKKLSLDLDTLQVESFSTVKAVGERGTVAGYINTEWPCSQYDSLAATYCGTSCDSACGESHKFTCGVGTPCGASFEYCETDLCQSDLCAID